MGTPTNVQTYLKYAFCMRTYTPVYMHTIILQNSQYYVIGAFVLFILSGFVITSLLVLVYAYKRNAVRRYFVALSDQRLIHCGPAVPPSSLQTVKVNDHRSSSEKVSWNWLWW